MSHNRNHKLDFGKYKDRKISKVPDVYLEWMIKEFEIDYWVELAKKELIFRCENNEHIVSRWSGTTSDRWSDMDDYWGIPFGDGWGDM